MVGCVGSLEDGPREGSRDTVTPETCTPGARATPTLSRLTRQEYDRSVTALTGVVSEAGIALPADESNSGLERGGPLATLIADQLETAAISVADRADLSRFVSCTPTPGDEEPCARESATRLARRAYRRPPTTAELDALMALYRAGSTDPSLPVGFEEGMRWVLSAVLVAPEFLYHEWGPLGGTLEAEDPMRGYAIASRLAFLVWGTIPDDTLLDAAAMGMLDSPNGVALQAERMLGDSRAREGVRAFFRQWLHIDRVGGLTKDATRFAGFDSMAAHDLETSLIAFTDHAFWQGGYTQLETSPNVWLNGRLTTLYGATGGPTGSELVPFELDPGRRAGLLGQPALLALLATSDQGHPIRRGVFTREHLLCQDLTPPPASVATPIPPVEAAPTTRERFAQHSADPSCNSCHQHIDGIGFALERFDAIGRARETEGGVAIDDSGRICSFPRCDQETTVRGQVELAEVLRENHLTRDCVTREWMRYAVHAPPSSVDSCELARISAELGTSESMAELLVAIATSELLGNAREGGQ